MVSVEADTAPNFWHPLAGRQDVVSKSPSKASIVHWEAPNTWQFRNGIPTFQMPVLLGSFYLSLGNQLINEWESRILWDPLYFLHKS